MCRNEPVTVINFLNSGMKCRLNGIGGQTMFKVIETQRCNLTKNAFQNLSQINGTYGEKIIQRISADSVVPTYASAVNKEIVKVAFN